MVSCRSSCLVTFLVLCTATQALSSTLSPYYYDRICPRALPTIKSVVEAAVNQERRMGASLLRLHFHDCFVNGCDASILLDPTPTIDSEKFAFPNINSARGFEVIDNIKSAVDKACGHPVVSCADILAVAARDSVVALGTQLGGPTWNVQLGRRDSTTANRTNANNDLPKPSMDLPTLIRNFNNQGLDVEDLVALSGAHTIGFAKCSFARQDQPKCPTSGGGRTILGPLDPTPAKFDTIYFSNLVMMKGFLNSDRALCNDNQTYGLVENYSQNGWAFSVAFAKSMIRMGSINPLTGNKGQIRVNCRKVN